MDMNEQKDYVPADPEFKMRWSDCRWHIKKTLNHPKADPEKRFTFCQIVEELEAEGKSIAYIDESGFAHDIAKAK